MTLLIGVFTISGVYLGLKWNVQIQKNEQPTIELPKIPNPVTVIKEHQQDKMITNLLDEWINGPKKE